MVAYKISNIISISVHYIYEKTFVIGHLWRKNHQSVQYKQIKSIIVNKKYTWNYINRINLS